MATHGFGQSADQLYALKAEIKRPALTVPELKSILRDHNLPVSGVKSELQVRLIAYVEKLHTAGNRAVLDQVRASVSHYPGPYTSSRNYTSPNTPAASASPQSFYSPHLKQSSHAPHNMAPARYPFHASRLIFSESPFYQIVRSLTEPVECKARESTRDTARVSLILSRELAEILQKEENHRVMVFCAAESLTGSLKTDITFPHQVELKCNDQEVKGNLRGLKNKPGSTRPADITSLLKKKVPGFSNTIEMVYALTNKDKSPPQKFYLVINLVMQKPVDRLVQELKRGKFISKEQVLREMQKQASDNDIEATSSVMSLKCPLSFTRIRFPCRGIGCKHNQCFDATSYLQLQEQAPTWTCPVCNKSVSWENLVLDQYVQDILEATSKDIEQVTIEPDGTWSTQTMSQATKNNQRSNPTPSYDDDDDDDDLVVVGPARHNNSFTNLTPNSVRTPPFRSREDSRAASSTPRSSSKRPRDEVIDLTLSDDDDAPPPVKKASLSSNPSSLRHIIMNSSSESSTNKNLNTSFRPRPPDQPGYYFHLPPPVSPASFNLGSRFGQTGGSNQNGAMGGNPF